MTASRQVMFIEIGTGVDLQGQDATKAAIRAVRDAIGRNYLPAMRRLVDGERTRMGVRVRIGAPAGAGAPDPEAVRAALPHGDVTVEIGPGGMLVPNGTRRWPHLHRQRRDRGCARDRVAAVPAH